MSEKVAILMAIYNREPITLQMLNTLQNCKVSGFDFDIFICDGGSSDGSVANIKKFHPNVNVLIKPGTFWNSGMVEAWKTAQKQSYDWYLLLNDDLSLDPGLFKDFFSSVSHSGNNEKIFIGRARDPITSEVTYSGLVSKSNIRKFHFKKVETLNTKCSTFNGNFVLVNRKIVERIGILDPAYTHGFGDIDYGLVATRFGIEITVQADVGTCKYNYEFANSHRRVKLSELKIFLTDPKKLPFRETTHFYKKHSPYLWPIFLLWRYLKILRLG
jgi:GT2 family glycosyltransferase